MANKLLLVVRRGEDEGGREGGNREKRTQAPKQRKGSVFPLNSLPWNVALTLEVQEGPLFPRQPTWMSVFHPFLGGADFLPHPTNSGGGLNNISLEVK